MLHWKLTSARQLQLVESEPEPIDDILNTKIKLEQILLTTHDINVYKSNSSNLVLGRYGVGVVSETSSSLLSKMDRVLINPSITCDNCNNCREGNHNKCLNVSELALNQDGLLCNFYNINSKNLYKLPDSLTFEEALFVPSVAMAINAIDCLDIIKGQHVAVWASSKMGLILAQLLSYYKAVPILISGDSQLIELAKSHYGVFYAFDSNECDITREVQIVTGGNMCHSTILLANSNFTLSDAVSLSAVNCTICITGTPEEDNSIALSDIVSKRISIVGSYNGIGSFDTAINLLVTKQVSVKELETHHIPFNDVNNQLSELLANEQPQNIIIDVD